MVKALDSSGGLGPAVGAPGASSATSLFVVTAKCICSLLFEFFVARLDS